MTGSDLITNEEAAIVRPLPTDDEITRLYRLANAFAASGIYKDIKQAEAAFAKMIVGRDLGLSIAQSMQGVQFVQGQIQLHYSLLAMVIRSRGYSWEKIERSETRAAAKFFAPDGEYLDEVEFTIENAEKAGLTRPSRSGEPSMYTKYPRNMLWARMMSDAVRFVVPEATGGIPVYAPGELSETPALDEGEGDGTSRGIELPPEVEEVIARAEALGHVGLAERSAWVYAVDRGEEAKAARLSEAKAELDAMAAVEEIQDANVEPDVPIDDADLPPVSSDVRERVRSEADEVGLGEAASEAKEPIAKEQADPGFVSSDSAEDARSELPAQDPTSAAPTAGGDTPGSATVLGESPAPYVEYLAAPDKNELYYRHPGCDGTGARWRVPLDDVPLPLKREKEECVQCAQTFPLRESEEEKQRVAESSLPASSEGAAKGKPAVQEPEVPEIELFRRRLALVREVDATTEEEKKLKEADIDWLEQKVQELAAAEAASNPDQPSLLG